MDLTEIFLFSARAILPILLIIALGFGFARFGSWDQAFYKKLNRLCFSLFLPVQLFCSIYAADDLASLNWPVVGYLLASVFVCAGIGLLAVYAFRIPQEQKGVLVQASFRSNQAILGLPLANALGGDAAMAFASVATSVCVPLYNVLAVVCLTCFARQRSEGHTARSVLRGIARNPLIWGCLLGLAAVGIRQLLPVVDGQPVFTIRENLPSVYQALSNLSKVASPMMLFVLGAGLDFQAIRGLLPRLCLGVVLRLVIAPVLVIGTAVALRGPLQLTTLEMPTLVAVCASPVAVSSAVMTQQIGGDSQLASQLVVWTSVLSMLSIFCIVFVLRAMALL